jgi:hypothetical protein
VIPFGDRNACARRAVILATANIKCGMGAEMYEGTRLRAWQAKAV